MDDLGLVGDLALVGSAALVGGMIVRLLRGPVILGYLAAGLAISPNTPGFVGDIETVRTIADLGVALLMFTIGVRFSLRELMQARDVGILGGLSQVILVGAGGTLIGYGVGLSIDASLAVGAVAALSSTMMALRMLEQAGEIGQAQGKIAISISLVQDLAAVPMIVMIPVLAGEEENFAAALGLAAGKGVALVAGVWIVGTVVVPRVHHVALAGAFPADHRGPGAGDGLYQRAGGSLHCVRRVPRRSAGVGVRACSPDAGGGAAPA